MQVQALQQFLSQMAPFLKAAGGSESAAREISYAVECLEPFKYVALADFSKFLRMAEECIRTNKFAEPKKKTPPRAKAGKAPKLTVAEAAQKYLGLKERATDPTLTYAMIDAEMEALAGLAIKDLKELSKQVNAPLPSSAKKKDQMVAEFKRHIKELKESRDFNRPRTEQAALA
jgi:hypothetical protein